MRNDGELNDEPRRPPWMPRWFFRSVTDSLGIPDAQPEPDRHEKGAVVGGASLGTVTAGLPGAAIGAVAGLAILIWRRVRRSDAGPASDR
jgi:hypothetical protein